ncbi:MAG TPA: hypothetical protein PKY05_16310, partial [Fibrobacteria bacterium]|nr:hypothetical protein [Fibrobacteria bacterium]
MAVLVGVLARVVWGFRLGVVNNEFHFPILLSAREALPFRGDALVATLGNFASPLWFFLSALPSSWGLESILEVVFVFSRILLAWGVGLIVGSLVSSDAWRFRARLAGAVSTLASGWILNLAAGADPVVSTYFSQTFLSIGLIACALGFGFSGKGWASALFLGLAYDVNLMQANFAAGILLPVWILEVSWDRQGARKLLQWFAIAAVAGAPGLFAILQVVGGPKLEGILSGRELSDFAAFHIPGHFFWGMKSSLAHAQALSLVLIAPLAAWLSPRRSRTILAAAVVPLAYLVVQIVLQQVLPSRFLFQLHLFRSDVVCYLLVAGICIGAAIDSASTSPRREVAIWTGASVLVLTGNFIPALALLVGLAVRERLAGLAAIAATLGVFGAMLVLERSVGVSGTTIAVSCLAWLAILPAPKHPWFARFHAAIAFACLAALCVMSFRTCTIDIRREPRRDEVNYRAALERARAASPAQALF